MKIQENFRKTQRKTITLVWNTGSYQGSKSQARVNYVPCRQNNFEIRAMPVRKIFKPGRADRKPARPEA